MQFPPHSALILVICVKINAYIFLDKIFLLVKQQFSNRFSFSSRSLHISAQNFPTSLSLCPLMKLWSWEAGIWNTLEVSTPFSFKWCKWVWWPQFDSWVVCLCVTLIWEVERGKCDRAEKSGWSCTGWVRTGETENEGLSDPSRGIVNELATNRFSLLGDN